MTAGIFTAKNIVLGNILDKLNDLYEEIEKQELSIQYKEEQKAALKALVVAKIEINSIYKDLNKEAVLMAPKENALSNIDFNALKEAYNGDFVTGTVKLESSFVPPYDGTNKNILEKKEDFNFVNSTKPDNYIAYQAAMYHGTNYLPMGPYSGYLEPYSNRNFQEIFLYTDLHKRNETEYDGLFADAGFKTFISDLSLENRFRLFHFKDKYAVQLYQSSMYQTGSLGILILKK